MANWLKKVGAGLAGMFLENLKNGAYGGAKAFDPLSYHTLLRDRDNFRKSGGVSSDPFNMADTPGRSYYRILFHFFDDDQAEGQNGYGFLHPTWALPQQNEDTWRLNSSAYSYLKLNKEDLRAEHLMRFCHLLSNINTASPWYWKSIKGLGDGLSRKEVNTGLVFGNDRRSIQIECLPDAVDNRIRTLIDLYREIVFSWRTKREIIPSNLRKFDMTICLLQSPITGIHTPADSGSKITDLLGAGAKKYLDTSSDDYATANAMQSEKHIASYKIFELHGCEFDIASGQDVYNNLDNQEGLAPEYILNIFYDDVIEYSYNEFSPSMKEIGDMVTNDTLFYPYNSELEAQGGQDRADSASALASRGFCFPENDSELKDRIAAQDESSMVGQLLSFATQKVSNKVSKVVLGNLFGFSLQNATTYAKQLTSGQIATAITSNKRDYSYNGAEKMKAPYKSLQTKKPNKPEPITPTYPNIFEKKTDNGKSVKLGNLFGASTLLATIK